MHEKAHRVVIIGGGFGGLWATRGLANTRVNITFVDGDNQNKRGLVSRQLFLAGNCLNQHG